MKSEPPRGLLTDGKQVLGRFCHIDRADRRKTLCQPACYVLGLRDRLNVARILELLILDCHRLDILGRHAKVMGASGDTRIERVHMAANFARCEAEFAARGQDNQFLTAENRLDREIAARQVERECTPDPRDMVDPGLQCRRHAVIIHGRAKRDDIGADNLINQLVR